MSRRGFSSSQPKSTFASLFPPVTTMLPLWRSLMFSAKMTMNAATEEGMISLLAFQPFSPRPAFSTCSDEWVAVLDNWKTSGNTQRVIEWSRYDLITGL